MNTGISKVNIHRDLDAAKDKLVIMFNGFTYADGQPEDPEEFKPVRDIWLTDIDGDPICKIEVYQEAK